MMLWVLIAAMTAAAALAILAPLARKRSHEPEGQGADEAVYREQLAAIDKDLERGLIEEEAAEAARTEIARRLLAAHDRKDADVSAKDMRTAWPVRGAQILAIAALPVFTLGLYLAIGSPELSDQPLSARLSAPAEQQSVDELVARVERHLAKNPEDGEGWAIVAPVYMTLGDPRASVRAYANALRLLGNRPDWLANMGEAMTVANEGVVTQDARMAFTAAIELDPGAVKPRFFLAMALGQEGRREEALAAWEELLAGADESAAWVHAARQRVAALLGEDAVSGNGLSGPSAEDIAAAEQMSDADRQDMIKVMVESLAGRLQANGGSAEEWSRLMRAYMVLGQRDNALKAYADAKKFLDGNEEGLLTIRDAAGQLGLSES